MSSAAETVKPACEFREARHQDVPAIASLVNRAYRPRPGEAGWTHEAHLVAGTRTRDSQVDELMRARGSVLLVACRDDRVIGCVQVEASSGSSYIGMLAVDPALQAKGIGKQLLGFAERFAADAQGSSRLVMTVVSHRQELVAFYVRRGYQLTGRTQEFPAYAGVPKQPGLELVELEKPARSAGTDAASVTLST